MEISEHEQDFQKHRQYSGWGVSLEVSLGLKEGEERLLPTALGGTRFSNFHSQERLILCYSA